MRSLIGTAVAAVAVLAGTAFWLERRPTVDPATASITWGGGRPQAAADGMVFCKDESRAG